MTQQALSQASRKNGKKTVEVKGYASISDITPAEAELLKKDLRRLLQTAAPERNEQARTGRGGYLYLYDDYLKGGEYKAILANIEKRLTDFEIFGKIIRLTTFSNSRIVIEDELRRGIKNVVIVGNDETFTRILSKAMDLPVTYGFLPVGQKKNESAAMLGMPINEKACDVLAARKIETMDFGAINGRWFFLFNLYIPEARVKVNCDDKYFINAVEEKFELTVANLAPAPFMAGGFKPQPQDGKMIFGLRPVAGGILSSLVKKKGRHPSFFMFKKLALKADKSFKAIADGREFQESSLEITVNKKGLSLIVGKNRRF